MNNVVTIDIRNFFESVSARRIYELFISDLFRFNKEMATCLALLCTYRKKLPVGSPTSPVLSNLVFYHTDIQLMNFAHAHNLNYTRYADDLSFSSFQPVQQETLMAIKQIIRDSGFNINHKKTRIQSHHVRQKVTGITVNRKLNIDRRYVRHLRAVIYDIGKNGVEKAAMKYYKIHAVNDSIVMSFLHSVRGRINWIGQVRGRNDDLYLKFKEKIMPLNVL